LLGGVALRYHQKRISTSPKNLPTSNNPPSRNHAYHEQRPVPEIGARHTCAATGGFWEWWPSRRNPLCPRFAHALQHTHDTVRPLYSPRHFRCMILTYLLCKALGSNRWWRRFQTPTRRTRISQPTYEEVSFDSCAEGREAA
jgi:hypothetical protein